MVVAWVDPLQIELLLPVSDPGKHVHILPRSFDRTRMMTSIIRPTAITQLDKIVGQ